MKQTPVEWFAQELKKRYKRNNAHLTQSEWSANMIDKIADLAKEKELEQRKSDFMDGYKERAEISNLIFDEASMILAKQLFSNKLENQ